jgi:hypothetical protein
MRSEDPKALVKKKLKLLFEAIADHAAENPAFLASLERALASSPRESQELPPVERAPAGKKATGPNLLETLHTGGESALQEAVGALTTDELVRLVVQEGVRKMKEARSLDRAELVSLLQEMARNRLRQGEAFVRGGA